MRYLFAFPFTAYALWTGWLYFIYIHWQGHRITKGPTMVQATADKVVNTGPICIIAEQAFLFQCLFCLWIIYEILYPANGAKGGNRRP